MRFSYFFLFILMSLVLGCTSEDAQALKNHQQAKQSREIHAQLNALKALVLIDPRKYRMEFLQAETALESLKKAQEMLKTQQYYKSYVFAHDAYRSFPNKEAKAILVSSGKYFLPLLKVQNLIEKSFKILPTDTLSQLHTYHAKTPKEWNLAQVNALLITLSKSSLELTRAVTLLDNAKIDITVVPVEIVDWQNNIKQLTKQVRQLKGYLISLALKASSGELLLINKRLTEEATELLAYVKPEIAMNGLQPKFNEAYLHFNPYSELIKNISLAVSSAGLSIDVQWYKRWHLVEKQTLMLEGDFSQYVALSPTRMITIKKIMMKQNVALPEIADKLSDIYLFLGHNGISKNLVSMLKQDKSLL